MSSPNSKGSSEIGSRGFPSAEAPTTQNASSGSSEVEFGVRMWAFEQVMGNTNVVQPLTRPVAVPPNDFGFAVPDLSGVKIEAEKLFNWVTGRA